MLKPLAAFGGQGFAVIKKDGDSRCDCPPRLLLAILMLYYLLFGTARRTDVTREAVQDLIDAGLSLSAAAKRLRCSYQTARSRLEDGDVVVARPARRGRKPMTTEEFIRRARAVHGDRYNYDLVDYVRNDKKVCIICPTHGPFWQMPFKHLSGSGCSHPECANAKRVATNMERYGAGAILQVDEFKNTRQATVRARYGVGA